MIALSGMMKSRPAILRFRNILMRSIPSILDSQCGNICIERFTYEESRGTRVNRWHWQALQADMVPTCRRINEV